MSETHIYGRHVVTAVLDRSPESLLSVHFDAMRSDPGLNGLRTRVASMGLAAEECRRVTLEKMVGDVVHQGVVARVRPAAPMEEKSLYRWVDQAVQPLILILDGIQDPRNLGACIRSADAAGVDMVVMSRSESADLTPVARKAASGAAEWLPVARVGNLARVMSGLKERGVWLLGADERGDAPYYEAELTGSIGLVVGAEGEGLRRLTRQSCDAMVRIPMLGGVESLNVSVATGIILFEAVRQRRGNS